LSRAGRKQFFFEKKNQKTFGRLDYMLLSSAALTKQYKSFLFLFFKKEILLLRRSVSLEAGWYEPHLGDRTE